MIVLNFLGQIWDAFSYVWFLILPFLLYHLFSALWIGYVAGKAGSQIENVVLEIIPPRDIEKSPQIMEKFFDALSATHSGSNVMKKYIKGYVLPTFSFEIVASEGMVHFYLVTPENLRSFVESALYAQYPEVEIVEVDDYVTQVPAVIPSKEWTLFSADMEKVKHDAYPIKTYKNFKEDITGKMIDPLGSLMETMGAVGPNQFIWLQYIIEPVSPAWADTEGKSAVNAFIGRKSPAKKSSMLSSFFKDLLDILKSIPAGLLGAPLTSSSSESDSGSDDVEAKLTPGEKKTLTALEENISKSIFETKMRLMILGKKDGFSKVHFGSTVGSTIKQFADNHLNSLKPHALSKTDVDYVFKKRISESRMRKQLIRYRDRDNSGATFKFSSEELATVFHMPDMSVVSPSVRFVDSRKSGAPSNLPFM